MPRPRSGPATRPTAAASELTGHATRTPTRPPTVFGHLVGGDFALIDDFEAAQARVKTLTSNPSPDELLELCALLERGTKGDVPGSRYGKA